MQTAAGGGNPETDPEMGAANAGEGAGMADPRYEDQMGQLQYYKKQDLAEPAAGGKAQRVSGGSSGP